MAFGFQNCCDTEEYFYLNGIPATVSENEVYQISTLEGVDFCATYTELPELFYQPLTYTLDVMVEQTSCTTCLESLPCPETIEVPLDNNVTISNYNECSVLTELPLEVECRTIQPSPGGDYGQIRLQISGGQPPYSIFSANTTTQVYGAADEGLFTIIFQAPPGDYCYDVIDSYNATVSLCCTVNFSPAPLVVSCSSTPSSVWEDTGSVSLTINGESPFTVYYQGNEITLPLTQLSAGTYDLTVIDSIGQTDTVSCTVGQTIPNYTYPQYLCMTFQFCDAAFYLTFLSAGTSNYLPYYTLDNPSEIGVTSMTLSADTSFNWFTSTAYSNTSELNVPPTCSLSPASNGNVQFTKNTSGQPSPLGNWSSNGIFGVTQASVTSGQCVEVSPTFVATPGTPVCILDGSSNGTAHVIPSGGAGAPYTIYVGGLSYDSNQSIPNLSVGPHTVQVSDSQGNLSTVGSVTIGSVNPQNLLVNSCGQLISNLNSIAGFLNADFLVTSSLNNWPAGTTVTCNLILQVYYTYTGPDYEGNTGAYLVDWLYDVNINNQPISSSLGGISLPFVLTDTTDWQQTSSIPQGFNVNCVSYNKTQNWETGTITLTNTTGTLISSIDTIIQGQQFINPQTCNGVLLTVNFSLRLVNLEVVTGNCVLIDDSEGLLLNYTATQTIPQNGYQQPFIGSFLNGTGCLSQLNCNQNFTFSQFNGNTNGNLIEQISASPSSPSYTTPFGEATVNTLHVISNGQVLTSGSNSVPSTKIYLGTNTCLTVGQTYYFKFYFTVRPTVALKFSFEASWGYASTIISFTINPNSINQDNLYYTSSVYQGQCITSSKMYIFRTLKDNVNPEFYMQISLCSFI